MVTEETFDILVLGAGPAGAAAALFAANKGLSVAVLERQAHAAPSVCLEWLHPRTHELLAAGGASSRDAVLGTIVRMRLADVARGRSVATPVDVKSDVVDSARLTQEVLAAATAAGARVFMDTNVTAIAAQEEVVELSTETSGPVCGRLLIAADGHGAFSVRRLGLDVQQQGIPAAACCQMVCVRPNVPAGADAANAVEPTWIVSSEDLSSFGTVSAVNEYVSVCFVAPGSPADVRATFDRSLPDWRAAGVLPEGLDDRHARRDVRPIPRGVALGMETHVAKRTVVIGDAGGFVGVVGHEGLYPAIWGARIAVDVCAEALGAPHTQDVLSEFNSRWRREMVTHLNSPNADLRFLLPMVFSNERMARRLANALLGGENL